MKFFRFILFVLSTVIIFTSCQKELTAETENAVGALAKDASGNCTPFIINGSYKKDTLLNVTNFVDAQVNVTSVGNYTIITDTVNGYYFRATGVAPLIGANTVRLLGFGRPVNGGTDNFVLKFGGTVCEFNVNVTGLGAGGSSTARYTFANTGAACAGAIQTPNFYVGLPTNPVTHTITIFANVTIAGTYTLTTNAVNGLTFTGSGTLSVGINQPIVLGSSGTPTTAIAPSYIFNTTIPASSCGFDLVVQNAPAQAAFTFGCAGASFSGTYQVGTAMNSGNTITVPISVTTGGAYNITATANGVTFSKSGILPATPTAQSLSLIATGTPTLAAAPSTVFTLNAGGAASCPISIPFTNGGGGSPATFGYICSNSIIEGTFQASVPLTISDVIKIPVYVGASGIYSLTTNSINGVTFSASGNLIASFNEQFIILKAVGQIPNNTTTQSVIYNLTDLAGSGVSCSNLTVPFTFGVASDYLRTKIDGGPLTNLNTNLVASMGGAAGAYTLDIDGEFSTLGKPALSLTITSVNPIGLGTYNQASTTSSVFGQFRNYNGTSFYVNSGSGGLGQFTVQITSITTSPNRITGVFSGTLKDNLGTGLNSVILTSGEFNVPY